MISDAAGMSELTFAHYSAYLARKPSWLFWREMPGEVQHETSQEIGCFRVPI